MDTAQMFATIGLFAAFLAALTQNVKTQLGISGRALLLVSVGLGIIIGALLGAGGIMDFRALSGFPGVLSGAVLGALSGLGASGGTDWAKNLTRGMVPVAPQPTAPTPVPAPEAAWQEVDLATYSRTDWPAVPGLDDAPPTWRP